MKSVIKVKLIDDNKFGSKSNEYSFKVKLKNIESSKNEN